MSENEGKISYEDYKKILNAPYDMEKHGRVRDALLRLDLSTVEPAKRGAYSLMIENELRQIEMRRR